MPVPKKSVSSVHAPLQDQEVGRLDVLAPTTSGCEVKSTAQNCVARTACFNLTGGETAFQYGTNLAILSRYGTRRLSGRNHTFVQALCSTYT